MAAHRKYFTKEERDAAMAASRRASYERARDIARLFAEAPGFMREPFEIDPSTEAKPLIRAKAFASAASAFAFDASKMFSQWARQLEIGRTSATEHGLNARDISDVIAHMNACYKLLVQELVGSRSIVLAAELRDAPPAEMSSSADSLTQLASSGLN